MSRRDSLHEWAATQMAGDLPAPVLHILPAPPNPQDLRDARERQERALSTAHYPLGAVIAEQRGDYGPLSKDGPMDKLWFWLLVDLLVWGHVIGRLWGVQ